MPHGPPGNTQSSKEIDETKRIALVEIQKLQTQVISMTALCVSEKTRLDEQSDRDTADVMSMTSAVAASEQRAKTAETSIAQCEATGQGIIAGLRSQNGSG